MAATRLAASLNSGSSTWEIAGDAARSLAGGGYGAGARGARWVARDRGESARLLFEVGERRLQPREQRLPRDEVALDLARRGGELVRRHVEHEAREERRAVVHLRSYGRGGEWRTFAAEGGGALRLRSAEIEGWEGTAMIEIDHAARGARRSAMHARSSSTT